MSDYTDLPNGVIIRNDRHWHSGLRQWVHDNEIRDALDAFQLAISEYYNGDRAWAEQWLIKAYEANQPKPSTAFPATWQEEH